MKIFFAFIGASVAIIVIFQLFLTADTVTSNQQADTFDTSIAKSVELTQLSKPTFEIEGLSAVYTVDNFTLLPETKLIGKYVYKRTYSQFEIMFFAGLSAFTITLRGDDIRSSHQQASYEFIDLLGVSPEVACDLHVHVAESGEGTEGGNMKLQFCE